ncbi:hypothetical protein MY4038_008964, partial [Beauveria bassiana]
MACQILLDFSPRSSGSSSSSSSSSLNLMGGAVGPEAPLGRTQTGATPSSPSQGKSRKNNTPVDSGGGSRHHHMLQTPPESPPHHHRSETTALLALGSVHQHHINIETEPPDWDLQEGIRY